MTWPQSPPAANEQCVLPLEGTTAARYAAWRATEAGRVAFDRIVDLAVKQAHAGAKRVSTKALAEQVRPSVPGGLDNRWTAFIARELASRVPEVAPLIEFRKQRAA